MMKPVQAGDPLSPREIDVIRLVGQAKPNKQIAFALGLTEGTVKVHLTRIFTKLSMGNRVELALWAANPQR